MDIIEKDVSALGCLFQQIMVDMKSSYSVWEDFTTKSAKLHSALRATVIATSAFLDSFQKVADMATNTRGATRDIGSALTRLCIRHKSIESKLKKFNNSILDLGNPLQEKMEEWKKNTANLDKEHAKEYKRSRAEIKRASSDTIRLQKKARKGSSNSILLGKSDVQLKLDSAMHDVNAKFSTLEDIERNFVRQALIEERARFCFFVSVLKPVVDHEIAMLTDVTHLQEITQSLCMQASDPSSLPASSEQVILDLKGADYSMSNFTTPPSSPSSLGSRKSSMCSISSFNSSASGSSTQSPSHRAKSKASSQQSSLQDGSYVSTPDDSTTSSISSSWTSWPESGVTIDRPHTISAAYEKHARPMINSQTFEPPDPGRQQMSAPSTPNPYAVPVLVPGGRPGSLADIRPPVPGPKPRSKAVPPPIVPGIEHLPIYANVSQTDLAGLSSGPIHEEDEENDYEDDEDDDDDDATTPTPSHSHHSMAIAVQQAENAVDRTRIDRKNATELADAIKELEASTAALSIAYDASNSNRNSLQSSSGYCSMTNTPACSEDGSIVQGKRSSMVGTAVIRRSSMHASTSEKPPVPPIRCTPSIPGVEIRYIPSMSNSSIYTDGGEGPSEPEYADPQELMDRFVTESCNNQQSSGIYMLPNVVPSGSSVIMDHGVPIYTSIKTVQTFTSIPVTDTAGVHPPPPPPPLPLTSPDSAVPSQFYDNDPDLELPPPPTSDELAVYATAGSVLLPEVSHTNGMNNYKIEQNHETILRETAHERKEVGSVIDKHANIIANLNAQFAIKPGPAGKPLPTEEVEMKLEPELDEQEPVYGFLGQIQRGISLKRTATNDRSAPNFN